MKTVNEARTLILSKARPLGSQSVFLSDATGRILSGELFATRNLPPRDNSAMDGYGVKAADLQQASEQTPVELKVVGQALPGAAAPREIQSGEVVRIMTGAPVSPGVDAVVMRENTDESGVDDASGQVKIFQAQVVGGNIRRAGEDVQAGDVVGTHGERMTPARTNLLAAAGHAVVPVHRRPQVAILSSGDELREVGAALSDTDIVNSNAHAIAAAVMQAGGEPVLLGIAADTLDDHVARIDGARHADVLLTIGGVSMGTHDFVRPALSQLGVELDFWKVAMRPGKPLAFGQRGRQLVFGLPGNPVSSLVSFELFVGPALRKLSGHHDVAPMTRQATLRLESPMKKREDFEVYARAVASWEEGVLVARPLSKQGSGQISGIAMANCLAVLPAGKTEVVEGEQVSLISLGDAYFR